MLLGFYHSHPDHPPIPSDTDNACAWPFFSYLITAVEKGESKVTKIHVLELAKKELKHESIELLNS